MPAPPVEEGFVDVVVLIVLAVVSGLAIAVQGQLMGLLDQTLGTGESVFITYAGGGLLAAMVMLLAGGGNLRAWPRLPWYVFTTGVLGLVIVGSIAYVVPRLGVARGFTLIVAAQFMAAAVIDHFGFFGASVQPLSWNRGLGFGAILTGVWLVVRQG